MEATSQVALSKVHLNKFGSYFKFLSGDINLNSGPTTRQEIICHGKAFLFKNVVFLSTGQMNYQLDSLPDISNDALNIFEKDACTSSM